MRGIALDRQGVTGRGSMWARVSGAGGLIYGHVEHPHHADGSHGRQIIYKGLIGKD